jgi:hypothetical protein
VAEQEGDQQPPHATIAVEKRMDGLELHVCHCCFDQDRERRGLVVEKALQIGHAIPHGRRWRRYKEGVAGARATDPVLAPAKLARLFLAPATAGEEAGVNLANEPYAQREALAQACETMLERRNVVRDLDHLVDRDARCLLHLEEEQVREGRLRAFDLGGEHGLLADVGVEKEIGVRQEQRDAVQPAKGEQGPLEERLDRAVKCQRRVRGQRHRDECPGRLAADARDDLVPSGLTALDELGSLFK